ncbi:tetratricopeptide repeat protein, partial [Streptomyces sp. NRRL S-378]|uniref:tetratricopeptide repeat protein n=1 Tax=Streptomyces sp. NRRL S-378 TaxID=1463904 RepID=UPI00056AE4DB
MLEERGDVEGAITAYRQAGTPLAHQRESAVQLAQLLSRHGRGDEAIELMRTLVDSPGGAEDWLVDTLCTLYADHGRAQEGLAHLDVLQARRGGEEEGDLYRLRLRLMADCGLLDEAVERAWAHPEGHTSYAVWTVADLLAAAGRTEAAVAVLEPHAVASPSSLAGHLITLGRVKEAVALLQQRPSDPPARVWTGTFSSETPS